MLWDIKYPKIDLVKTGERMKKVMTDRGYSVREIQQFLHLSCPQPVYRWFRGETLPKTDYLYALSELFGVNLEELLVAEHPCLFGGGYMIMKYESGRAVTVEADTCVLKRRLMRQRRLRAYQGL